MSIGLVLLTAIGAVRLGTCLAAEPDARSQDAAELSAGVLVLQDGGVLTGQISSRSGRYVVAQANGEINVAASQVMLVARSLEDAYDQQRDRLNRPTAEAHLKLAQWCLRHELGPQAARELLDARGLDPRHPHLQLLERRLAALAATCRRRQTPHSAAAPSRTTRDEELGRLADLAEALPDDALERFTRKVQPVLVNNCTTAGCHRAGGEQSFQLDRAMLHNAGNRRSTLRNLDATLALIDGDAPRQSQLLIVPRQPHGGMEQPLFGPRQDALLAHLTEWVDIVTGVGPPPAETLAEQGEGRVQSSVYNQPSGRLVEPVKRVAIGAGPPSPAAIGQGTTPPANSPEVIAAGYDAPSSAAEPARRVRRGVHLAPWQPRDPFDAEIFNQRSREASGTESTDPLQPARQATASDSSDTAD